MRLPTTLVRPAAADLPLDRESVLRLLGYKPGITRIAARDEALIEEGIALTRAAAEPAASLAYCSVVVEAGEVIPRALEPRWRSRQLAAALDGAFGVSLVAATLGAGVDRLIDDLFRQDEFALAVVADAAGSLLVHGLSLRLREYLAPPGGEFRVTALHCPGFGDWALEDETPLAEAAGSGEIGLAISEMYYMQPRKSQVGVIGWLPAGDERERPAGCAACRMENCAFRETAAAVRVRTR